MGHGTVRSCLSLLLAAAFWPVIFLWLLDPASSWAPSTPLLRILLALVLAGLSTLVVAPGQPRRQLAGWFFFVVVCTSVVKYGNTIGLHSSWQRWLVGLLLSSPFIYLFAASTPGLLKSRLDTWRERRNRR